MYLMIENVYKRRMYLMIENGSRRRMCLLIENVNKRRIYLMIENDSRRRICLLIEYDGAVIDRSDYQPNCTYVGRLGWRHHVFVHTSQIVVTADVAENYKTASVKLVISEIHADLGFNLDDQGWIQRMNYAFAFLRLVSSQWCLWIRDLVSSQWCLWLCVNDFWHALSRLFNWA